MLHITEYSTCYICQVNPIQYYHRTSITPLIIFLRRNVALGCHTQLAKFNYISMHEGRDCLTSNRNYTPLMSFSNLNRVINIHKYPKSVNEIYTPILFGFESMKGLGHTQKYSTSFTHSFQPQAKLPIFQQKVNNEVHESQHTLTLPLDCWLNPGLFIL